MKSVVVIGDGMSDWPIDRLGGKTPLMVAKKPSIDRIAEQELQWALPKLTNDVEKNRQVIRHFKHRLVQKVILAYEAQAVTRNTHFIRLKVGTKTVHDMFSIEFFQCRSLFHTFVQPPERSAPIWKGRIR